jgi:hypothetical protein
MLDKSATQVVGAAGVKLAIGCGAKNINVEHEFISRAKHPFYVFRGHGRGDGADSGYSRALRKRTNSAFCSGGSASAAASISSKVLTGKLYHPRSSTASRPNWNRVSKHKLGK